VRDAGDGVYPGCAADVPSGRSTGEYVEEGVLCAVGVAAVAATGVTPMPTCEGEGEGAAAGSPQAASAIAVMAAPATMAAASPRGIVRPFVIGPAFRESLLFENSRRRVHPCLLTPELPRRLLFERLTFFQASRGSKQCLNN